MATATRMQFKSALSHNRDAEAAAQECVRQIKEQMGQAPDVAFVFASPHYQKQFAKIQEILLHETGSRHLLGCSAGGVIGGGHEVEGEWGLSVTAALLPGVNIHPFHLSDENLPGQDSSPKAWEAAVGVPASSQPQFVLLADAFMNRADELLSGMDYAYPGSAKVGGLASSAGSPQENGLMMDDRLLDQGAVGLALTGNIRVDTLVAQGCRPIGKVMTVRQCQRHFLLELDLGIPLEVLADLYEASSERDRRLMSTALFLGICMDPFKVQPLSGGDFLVRNVLGRSPDGQGLAIGAYLREGMSIQFHVRDARTAKEDLNHALARYKEESSLPHPHPAPSGALLFSCLGRGKRLFGKPNHDSGLFFEQFGPVPLGGFFCNGEIGPVSGHTYLHGFTSSFGIFGEKE